MGEARGNDTLAAVRQLCLAGPTQQQVDAVLQQYERGLEDQLQQNSFWLTQICTNYQSSRYQGELMRTYRYSMWNFLNVIKKLNVENLRDKSMELLGCSLGLGDG